MAMALIGGICIGLAASLMLLYNGRVTGISGIVSGILSPLKNETLWRISFVIGLLTGGLLLRILFPESLVIDLHHMTPWDYAFAGILVGFGTALGNGCTSGHGVCGISRFSKRSIFATGTFIIFGVISVLIFKFMRGEL